MTEMIRDCLIVGIRDKALSEKLQLCPELTLEQAKTTVQQKEAVCVHQQVLRGVYEGESVEDGQQRQGARFDPAEEKHSASKPGSLKQSKQCTRCGKDNTLGILVLLWMSPVTDVTTKEIMVYSVDPGSYLRYGKSQAWIQPLSTHSHKLHVQLNLGE